MTQASLLIFCFGSASSTELDDWLLERVAELDTSETDLYRASAPSASTEEQAEPDGAWLLALSGTTAEDARLVRELVGEMRLLGLGPVIFRPGSPVPYQGLANVF